MYHVASLRSVYRASILGILLLLCLANAAPAEAQLLGYSDRTSFEAVFTTVTTESFEDGIIGVGNDSESFSGPLNSTTNNGVFSTGQIPAGLEFENSSTSDDLILAGASYNSFGWNGFPSQVLIPSSDANSLNVTFPSITVYGVGMDLFGESDTVRVSVYTTGDVLVDTFDMDAPRSTGAFLGVTSGQPITRVNINAPEGGATGSFEAIDNVVFTTEEPAMLAYTDSTAFQNDFPTVTTESFEDGTIGGGNDSESFAGPLNSTTNNGVFSTGQIPAGLELANSNTGNDLILAGTGYNSFGWSGFPSQVLIPSSDANSLDITFPSITVYGVGLDVFGETPTVRVSVTFGGGGIFSAFLDLDAPTQTGAFAGIGGSMEITLANVNSPEGGDTGAFEAADNVRFSVDPLPVTLLEFSVN